MKQEIFAMSEKEINLVNLIEKVLNDGLPQIQAAKQLCISTRQFRNRTRQYQKFGPKGVISKKRGKPSNNKYSRERKEKALSIIHKDYYDYGPTLAAEKLSENHKINISKETIRNWMAEAGLWKPKFKKEVKVYQPRYRRPCFGELIQVDGSIHPWFEDRGPQCTLLVFIDDATSEILKLLFVDTETTLNYFEALKGYLEAHGKPVAFYTDKHNVFKVNVESKKSGTGLTQFGRALKELGVEPIFAHSAQAKGRVERANRVLQDRLVKHLRYHNISDIKTANKILQDFQDDYNNKFAKMPKSPLNRHIPLTEYEKNSLDLICSVQQIKTISKNLTVRMDKIIYKIKHPEMARRLRDQKVILSKETSGKIKIYYNGQSLNYEIHNELLFSGEPITRKELDYVLNAKLKLPFNHMGFRNQNRPHIGM